MKRNSFRNALCLFLLLFWCATSAFALSLDSAKSEGLVGETTSGYLESVTPSPSGEVQNLLREINGKRREMYEGIAQKNGTSLNAVEALAGKKAIAKTPSGQFVKTPQRGWQKR
ncbi:YdbL family protein [bacterium]|nr:YdbL family protein [bacterium]